MRFLKAIFFVIPTLLTGQMGFSQLTVTANNNAQALVQAITGAGITTSNEVLNCPNGASAFFTATNTGIDVTSGILLATGTASNAIGPNNSSSFGNDFSAPGDADLDIIAAATTYDACALEFDLIPNCDTISISFVFGSEEYLEFCNTGFNDAFAFLISGPNITGTNNLAVVPNTTVPVTINTINDVAYSTYYEDNSFNQYPFIQYDGFTKNLIATQIVVPCSTYHIKLTIADGGDGIYDSGVFLEENGFKCTNNQLSLTTTTANPNSPDIIEGCVDGGFLVCRSGDTSQAVVINYVVGGTATPNADYPALSGAVTIPAMTSCVLIPISAVYDGIPEAVESVTITVADTVCNTVTPNTATIYLADRLEINAGPDISYCEVSSSVIGSPAIPNPTWLYSWTPALGLDDPTLPNPTVSGLAPGNYQYILSVVDLNGCTDSDTIAISPVAKPVSPFEVNPDTVCVGQSLFTNLLFTPDPNTVYSWGLGSGTLVSGSNAGPLEVSWPASGNQTIYLAVSVGNCPSDTTWVDLYVAYYPVASFTLSDTVCDGQPALATFTGTTTGNTAQYIWDFSNATVTGPPNIGPFWCLWDTAGQHVVTLSLIEFGCASNVFSDTVAQFFPLQITALGDTTICWADRANLNAVASGGLGVNYTYLWSPTTTLTDYTIPNPEAFPLVDTEYIVLLSDGCSTPKQDTVQVLISPIPPPPTPLNREICAGESILLQVIPVTGMTTAWYYDPADVQSFFSGTEYITPTIGEDHSYYVSSINSIGCESDKVAVSILVNENPVPDFKASSTYTEIPEAIVTFEPIILHTNPIVTYAWSFGQDGTSEDEKPVYQYSYEGMYTVSLYVKDDKGCDGFVEKINYITVDKRVLLIIPNAFTPNGDGINEEFFIGHRLIKTFSIEIFDRWGNMVFRSNNPDFRWNGTNNGNPLPEGTFIYSISGTDITNMPVQQSGSITLIK